MHYEQQLGKRMAHGVKKSATTSQTFLAGIRPNKKHSSVVQAIVIVAVAVVLITFRVSRRRCEMYCGHPRLCLSTAAYLHYCMDPDVTWGMVGYAP